MKSLHTSIALASILAMTAAGCSKSNEPISKESGKSQEGSPATSGSGGGSITMTGAGATFPYPLYSKWMHEYHKLHSNIKISYQSIGSGGGIRQITARTVDFGATDAPMKDAELAKASANLVHVPMTIGAVAVVHNVDGVSELKLTPEVLASVFLGDIKKWNDPKIVALNQGAKLPDEEITVAHRSDGSGTTAVFSDYLSKVSPAWKARVGAGKALKWPTGLGAKGNEGVSGQVKSTPGTIGYVELAYAEQVKLPMIELKNASGSFVRPSLEGISAAAAGAIATMPADYRVSITNASGATAYPIAAFTYILVYADMSDATKAKTLVDFLWWATHDGQSMGPKLGYAALPAELVTKVEATLKSLTSGGKPVLQ